MDGKGLKYFCVYDIIESGICPVLFFLFGVSGGIA